MGTEESVTLVIRPSLGFDPPAQSINSRSGSSLVHRKRRPSQSIREGEQSLPIHLPRGARTTYLTFNIPSRVVDWGSLHVPLP